MGTEDRNELIGRINGRMNDLTSYLPYFSDAELQILEGALHTIAINVTQDKRPGNDGMLSDKLRAALAMINTGLVGESVVQSTSVAMTELKNMGPQVRNSLRKALDTDVSK